MKKKNFGPLDTDTVRGGLEEVKRQNSGLMRQQGQSHSLPKKKKEKFF